MQKWQIDNACSAIKKWCSEFNEIMAQMIDVVKGKRFIMFDQDVWYDYHTGLILPKFDSSFCKKYRIEAVGKIIDNHNPEDYFLPLGNFTGRCITTEEAKKIFLSNGGYPYKNEKTNMPYHIENYLFTTASLVPYKNPCNSNDIDYKTYSSFDAYNNRFRRMFIISEGNEHWCGKNKIKKLLVASPSFKGGFAAAVRLSFSTTSRKNTDGAKFDDAYGNVESGTLIPVYPLTEAHKKIAPRTSNEVADIVMKIIENKLVIEDIDDVYKSRLPYFFDTYKEYGKYLSLNDESIINELSSKRDKEKLFLNIDGQDNKQSIDIINNIFLYSDKLRANLSPYPARVLTDINMGHWELYEQMHNPPKGTVAVDLMHELPARPPQLDVKTSGICAIDFGTKSTVVVCRNREERLLRIGTSDYHKAPTMKDYENPTAIELRDIYGFHSAYAEREGRPFTEWEQITVSHQALDRLMQGSEKNIYQSVFTELKQWANDKAGMRRLRDQKNVDLLLQSYDTLDENNFDPIEIYAYYLGLYINNMVNGIYLEYILSFPVNYEKSIRARLRDSFEKGIKKSLPPAILRDKELMEDFRVYAGASEPAAYASCALKELGKANVEMQPTEQQPIYYGVFDFGGGTTDFDYGIWRLPTPDDKGSWNFVIEHFHAGGDVHLGGEKLLNILAYEVYKSNIDVMRAQGIPFALPKECHPFIGSEMLLTESDAAYLNRRRLSEILRPIWEEQEGYEKMGDEPQEANFYKDTEMASVKFKIDIKKLQDILRQRIKQGVESFFVGLLNAFRSESVPVFDILMAGNSCKSKIVQELFKEKMKRQEEEIKIGAMESHGQEKDFQGIFRLHLPLGINIKKDNIDFDRMPTGKTGVAFGLLDCRKGGHDVLVIDRNLSKENESPFRYYLGYSDRADKFHVLINKNVAYQEWVPFFYTNDDRFEVYYSSESRSLSNQIDITEVPAPKKCRIHYVDGYDEGMIYIRKVAPNCIEYTIADDKDIVDGNYWARVEKCELGN